MKLTDILSAIRPADSEHLDRARTHTAQLVMPPRALGRLHDIAERICAIRQTQRPSVARKAFLVMAADHGVAADGVSAFPSEVTGQMVQTFLREGAAINVLSRHVGAEVRVVDMGIISDLAPAALDGGARLLVRKVGRGTENLARGPAMGREAATRAVTTGFELASALFDQGLDLLGTGDMGIANTTPSAAIGVAFTGVSVEDMVGRGTGVDDAGLVRKQQAVRRGLEVNQPDSTDGLDVLAKVGGFEIGGIAGCVLAAAYHRRPLVVDGFISTAGALVAHALCPTVRDFLFAAHCSAETGHRPMLAHLGLEPLIDLGLRLGEGTGGALAMHLVEAATRIFNETMTFEAAGVSGKDE